MQIMNIDESTYQVAKNAYLSFYGRLPEKNEEKERLEKFISSIATTKAMEILSEVRFINLNQGRPWVVL